LITQKDQDNCTIDGSQVWCQPGVFDAEVRKIFIFVFVFIFSEKIKEIWEFSFRKYEHIPFLGW
jgi:hypothetical protein